MLLKRPWRWLLAVLGATLVLGLAFQVGRAFGAPQYLGLPTMGRFVVFLAVTSGLSLFVVPSYESLERDHTPLPPLPAGVRSPGNQPQPGLPAKATTAVDGKRTYTDPRPADLQSQRRDA